MLLLFFNLIADAPDNFQVTGFPWIDLDLLTDVANMDSYGVVGTDGLLIPYLFINLIDGENFSGILNEKQEDVIFDRCKSDQFSVHHDFFIIIIDLKTAAFIDSVCGWGGQVAKLGVAAQMGR